MQQEFYTAAGVPDFNDRRRLRRFLIKFAEEEEPHYAIAADDLSLLGLKVTDIPIDVLLWKTFFESSASERPSTPEQPRMGPNLPDSRMSAGHESPGALYAFRTIRLGGITDASCALFGADFGATVS